jgi:hypothetical protein
MWKIDRQTRERGVKEAKQRERKKEKENERENVRNR